jgi:hypothetical protein
MALHHALLSYLFGALLLAIVVNVVATLLKRSPVPGIPGTRQAAPRDLTRG